MSKHTPGPWILEKARHGFAVSEGSYGYIVGTQDDEGRYGAIDSEANARLIAAAPTQHEEMKRYLPIIERAEADAELWARLTKGTGIATANAYRAAIAKAEGGQDE